MATFTSREFSRNVSAAKKAAAKEPVFITGRDGPAYVLLSIGEYYRITGNSQRLLLKLEALECRSDS
jgi:PHD/YefM family antitoxin component YafN of YafNO toxin-antitoxin module